MKLIATGDWHLRYHKPANRTDDYLQAQKAKVTSMLQTAWSESAVIIQPGDFFDTPNIPFFLLAEYIHLFKDYKIPIFTVYGQHDLRYHTLHGNTPLNLLKEIGVIKILGNKPTPLDESQNVPVYMYGASWGEEIPVVAFEPDVYKILVLHKMVIGTEKLWFDQKDFVWGSQLLSEYNYDLIISGDNHKAFEVFEGKKSLLNCGSLMRMSIDQESHHPHFFLHDTKMRASGWMNLPFAPFDEVMNVKKVEKEKERNVNMEAFIAGLKDVRGEMGMDFVREMDIYAKENALDPSVYDIIKESMREDKK